MAFVKGQQKKGGKKKGTPNKKTALLKDMILTALNDAGGIDYLRKQADSEPVAFLGLIGKILPKEIDANVKGVIKGSIKVELV